MLLMSESSTLPWRYRAVAFDLDGLLIDTEPIFTETVRRFLAKRRLQFDAEFMRTMMGTPAAQSLPRFREHFRLPETVAAIDLECRDLFLDALGDRPGPLLPGARELVKLLHERRVPIAICTSSGREFVQRVFGPHGLLDDFDFVLTCDDVQRGKPFPDVYELAATRFGVSTAEMIVLEDSPNGLRAAKSAGARCIVIPHGLTPVRRLEAADAIVPSLDSAELLAMLFGR